MHWGLGKGLSYVSFHKLVREGSMHAYNQALI